MRGKLKTYKRLEREQGIIPACAGQIKMAVCAIAEAADHPRVCGANTKPLLIRALRFIQFSIFSSVFKVRVSL